MRMHRAIATSQCTRTCTFDDRACRCKVRRIAAEIPYPSAVLLNNTLLYHKNPIKFPLELQSDQDEHPMIAQVRILTASSRFVHCMIAREPKYDGKPYDSRRNAIYFRNPTKQHVTLS